MPAYQSMQAFWRGSIARLLALALALASVALLMDQPTALSADSDKEKEEKPNVDVVAQFSVPRGRLPGCTSPPRSSAAGISIR